MIKELITIQSKLKAPKNRYNKFGGFNYRSAEDILDAVKPLLAENECTLTLSDEVIIIGNRYYIKATATLTNKDDVTVTNAAYAREDETKKGMDGSQITGTASSYARKYALNGLFLIDDTKDADTDEFHNQTHRQQSAQQPVQQSAIAFTGEQLKQAIAELDAASTEAEYQAVWQKYSSTIPSLCAKGTEFYNACIKKANELKA